MTRLLILIAALVLYVAPPVSQAFATSHVRPPGAALRQPIPTRGPPPDSLFDLLGTFLSDNHEAFRTYGLLIAALAGFGFAFWRAKIATKEAKAAADRADGTIEQARAANEQARIAEQGHITERFSRAIEQLGHDSVTVRIGGLYALKRIAEDSVKRDHLAVMDVVTNFIRQPPYADAQRKAADREKALRAYRTNSAKENAEADPIDRADQTAGAAAPPPDPELIHCPDIVAAIEIIQGRSADQRKVEEKREYRLSLSRAGLSYLRLPEVDLQYIDLAGAHLRGTILMRANLTGAILTHADLVGADLTDTNLRGAILTHANLAAADLTDAKLIGAHLMCADLTGADLTRAHLTRAKFTRANLTVSNLTDAKLWPTKRWRTNITQEQLDSACIDPGGEPPRLPESFKPPQKVCVLPIR